MPAASTAGLRPSRDLSPTDFTDDTDEHVACARELYSYGQSEANAKKSVKSVQSVGQLISNSHSLQTFNLLHRQPGSLLYIFVADAETF